MLLKKELCRSWSLYAITDGKKRSLSDLLQITHGAILGGADVIQLRDKSASHDELIAQAQQMLKLTRAAGVPLIINDWVQVAFKSGADGVHLGQDDGPLSEAVSVLGADAIFGRSTHSLDQALAAEEEGFDYIGVGPVFSTPTKPGRPQVGLKLVTEASEYIKIPFTAIGGIDEANVDSVCGAGARCVAVVRCLMDAPDPQLTAQRLKQRIGRFR
jgi:thiamine-phosphate pyrophosphorylase